MGKAISVRRDACSYKEFGNQQVAANASLADQAAQQHLTELNGHIETAYHQLPTEARKNLLKVAASAGRGSRQAPRGTSAWARAAS
jgi:hypothetical protein